MTAPMMFIIMMSIPMMEMTLNYDDDVELVTLLCLL